MYVTWAVHTVWLDCHWARILVGSSGPEHKFISMIVCKILAVSLMCLQCPAWLRARLRSRFPDSASYVLVLVAPGHCSWCLLACLLFPLRVSGSQGRSLMSSALERADLRRGVSCLRKGCASLAPGTRGCLVIALRAWEGQSRVMQTRTCLVVGCPQLSSAGRCLSSLPLSVRGSILAVSAAVSWEGDRFLPLSLLLEI